MSEEDKLKIDMVVLGKFSCATLEGYYPISKIESYVCSTYNIQYASIKSCGTVFTTTYYSPSNEQMYLLEENTTTAVQKFKYFSTKPPC